MPASFQHVLLPTAGSTFFTEGMQVDMCPIHRRRHFGLAPHGLEGQLPRQWQRLCPTKTFPATQLGMPCAPPPPRTPEQCATSPPSHTPGISPTADVLTQAIDVSRTR